MQRSVNGEQPPDVPEDRACKYRAAVLERLGKFTEASREYRRLLSMASAQPTTEQDGVAGLYRCLLNGGAILDCLRLVMDTYFVKPNLLSPVRLRDLVEKYEAGDNGELDSEIGWPILEYIYHKENDLSLDTEKLFHAYDRFLARRGLERPSALGSRRTEFNTRELIFFLRHVCVLEVMDHSIRFESSEDLERERIAVCMLCRELDGVNSSLYDEEIESLRGAAAVRRAIMHVEESKVYIDVAGVERSLGKSFREKFDRYLAICGISDETLRRVLRLSGISVQPDQRVITFEDDAFVLFKDLFSIIKTRFISSGEYGLDSYLSVRIRHGTLSGQIRSQFETYHLITRRDKDGKYDRNSYWIDRLPAVDSHASGQLDQDLQRFSADVDALVDLVKTRWIQIKGKTNEEEGLFDFDYTDRQLKVLYAAHALVDSYDEFLMIAMRELWQRTEENLAVVRHWVSRTLKDDLTKLLDRLEHDVKAMARNTRFPAFVQAVTQCRTGIQEELEKVAGWFNLVDKKSTADFEFRHLVSTCQEILRRCFPLTKLICDVSVGGLSCKGGTFTPFVDILYIVLENIVRHSGTLYPSASISASASHGQLKVEVTNSLSDGADLETTRSRVEGLDPSPADAVSMSKARTEGGTGYFKLHKILRYDLGRQHPHVKFSVSDDRIFRVEIVMDADGVVA